MIYTYIALTIISFYALLTTGAYLEEKKAHRRTFEHAKQIITEHQETMDAMQTENARLALIAKAYRLIAISDQEI